MSRLIYVPIFDSFFESSIMMETVETRFLFLLMLRLASRPGANGTVDLPIAQLAVLAAMPEEDVKQALDVLTKPDPDSGSPAKGGRRLVPLDPDRPHRGWRVVNFKRYRDRLHRAHDAARKRRERGGADLPANVGADLGRPGRESVRKCPGVSGSGVTKTMTKTKKKTKEEEGARKGFRPPPISSFSPKGDSLDELQELYPHVQVGAELKRAASKAEATGKPFSDGYIRSWLANEEKDALKAGAPIVLSRRQEAAKAAKDAARRAEEFHLTRHHYMGAEPCAEPNCPVLRPDTGGPTV